MDFAEKEKLYGLIPETGETTRLELRNETGWDAEKISYLLNILYQEGMVSFSGKKQKFVSRVARDKIYEEHLDRNIDIPYLTYNIDQDKLDAIAEKKGVAPPTKPIREKRKHHSELEKRLAKIEGIAEPEGIDEEAQDDLEMRFVEVYKDYRRRGIMPTYEEMKEELNIPLDKVDELVNLLTSRVKKR